MLIPFYGANGATAHLATTTTTGRKQVLANAASTARWAGKVYNAGTDVAFLTSGDNTVTSVVPSGATPGGQPVAAGATEVLTFIGAYVAGINPTAGGNVYITEGYAVSI